MYKDAIQFFAHKNRPLLAIIPIDRRYQSAFEVTITSFYTTVQQQSTKAGSLTSVVELEHRQSIAGWLTQRASI